MSTTPDPPIAAWRDRFGRFELRRPLGRSAQTLLWLAFDPGAGRELLLAMPRKPAADNAALAAWQAEARRASRLDHPLIAPALEHGAHGQWPFVAFDRALGLTLSEWMAAQGAPAPADAARWLGEALQALAFAHDAGCAHRDLQPHMLLVGKDDRVRLLGLGVAARDEAATTVPPMQAQRDAAERDVLAAGVLLHTLLACRPAFDGESDLGRVIDRLEPHGREALRLPRVVPAPIAPPLRSIADRATSAQPRLRYRSARTLQQALDAWRLEGQRDGGGPTERLLQRMSNVGHLPGLPGVGARAAQLALMKDGRLDEMAQAVLEDPALSFELLRRVNSAPQIAALARDSGPVLTVRRAIAMLGLDGVRRAAAALQSWPGPLDDAAAAQLGRLFQRVRQAGLLAIAIRPAGFDAEVVFVVALLQNLGRLLVQYHFADEAAQLYQLMQPAPAERAGQREQPGLSEREAADAVFGIELEGFGTAVARHWGLADEALPMICRFDPALPVRGTASDGLLIRATASCANEAIDAFALPASRRDATIEKIAQRYARLLGMATPDLREALQRSRYNVDPATPQAADTPAQSRATS